jgi:D-alanine-D-alanine ligase
MDGTPPARPSAAEDDPRPRLVVLFGGQSAEHEVSCVSARHVLAAVDTDCYDVQPIGIAPSGEWLVAEDVARALAKGPDALPDALVAEGPAIEPVPALAPPAPGQPVVVFPLLHGPLGEDGTVQGLLELADVAYVGCGVLASALAMDKAAAKAAFAAAGIPQTPYVAFHERDIDAAGTGAFAQRLAGELPFPIFVKPANMGSSIGVSKAHDVTELEAALALARRYDEWLIAEEGVVAREIECAVLGNLDPRASVPGEIVPGAEFYDFDDKYLDGAAQLRIPAPLDAATTAELQALAVAAFRALRCEGMARVDFLYEEGGRGLLVNEINTIPGFTPISMYPKMWEASGVSYPALIDELVRLALERHARRAAKRRRA